MGAGAPHSTGFPGGIHALLQTGTWLGPVLHQLAIIKAQEVEGSLEQPVAAIPSLKESGRVGRG